MASERAVFFIVSSWESRRNAALVPPGRRDPREEEPTLHLTRAARREFPARVRNPGDVGVTAYGDGGLEASGASVAGI